MNELINIRYGAENATMSGRELHRALGVETPYTIWAQRMFEYGFSEGTDYVTNMLDRSDGKSGKPLTDHNISIAMAKEIAMLQRTDKGREIRQYLIKVEEAWNSPDAIMQRALQIANDRVKLLREQNDALTQQAAIMAPKAEFYDDVIDSRTAIDMSEAAKTLNMGYGRNKLFALLRKKGILQWNNQPYQRYVDMGWFRCVETKFTMNDGTVNVRIKTVVLQRGLDGIRRILRGRE